MFSVGIEAEKKKSVLKTFANFTEKHLCWSLFLESLLERDSYTGASL